jgi:hypothetical protein
MSDVWALVLFVLHMGCLWLIHMKKFNKSQIDKPACMHFCIRVVLA